MVAAAKKTKRAASWGRYEMLRRWRKLEPAERLAAYHQIIASAAADPTGYGARFVALLDWLVENAPRPRGRESQFTVEQISAFGRYMREEVVRHPGGTTIKRGIAHYAGSRGLDPSALARLWRDTPEFAGMRAADSLRRKIFAADPLRRRPRAPRRSRK